MHKKISKFAICLFILTPLLTPKAYSAEIVNGVPIPPERPDVMQVSPTYIEQLRNKGKTLPEQKTQPKNSTSEKHPPANNQEIAPQTQMQDVKTADILNIIAGPKIKIKNAPLPRTKPVITLAKANRLNEITTQAGIDDTKEIGAEIETTLVSFVLEPGEIHINENVESFLQNHALKLFQNDQNLTMQIHAYATPIDNTEYSDIRLSLARALEVRSFLINNNIDATRIKLNTMGDDTDNNSDDRIDLVFITSQN